jgi:NTE family protein
MQTLSAPPRYFQELLLSQLRGFLGDAEPGTLELLLPHLQWLELAGGETLMSQGDPGDAMYVLVSGRLRALMAGEDGQPRVVREIPRGQVVGEMSLFTDAPRSATVMAVRDSVLVRLERAAFRHLLSTNGLVSISLTRQIIERLSTQDAPAPPDRPVTIGLLPITDGLDVRAFAERLAEPLRRTWRVALVDSSRLAAALAETDTAPLNRRVAAEVDEIAAAHDVVLLLADATATPWTAQCARHADELLLLADADAPPKLHPIETACLMPPGGSTGAAEVLVLLHPGDRRMPRKTAAWLDRRPLADHVNIRPTLDRDMARLARLQTRTATGLVLAGGGARGLAHLGIYQAMLERGVEVDVVGGTSIGAVMASAVASDQPWDSTLASLRKGFLRNPTGDFNWLPLLSLIKGQRMKSVVETCIQEVMGHAIDTEDLWKNFFCIATNYSQARQSVLRRGLLLKALQASVAIPGALPPVVRDGDLLCDGGTFNNFPVDVMRQMRGVGRVLGVDLVTNKPRRIDNEHVPGSWELLLDRLRPRSARRFRLPSLAAYLVNATILYGMSRQERTRRMTDQLFNPPLTRLGLLDWRKFDSAVRQGYEHACEVLDGKPPA